MLGSFSAKGKMGNGFLLSKLLERYVADIRAGFFDDKDHFLTIDGEAFDKERIVSFSIKKELLYMMWLVRLFD